MTIGGTKAGGAGSRVRLLAVAVVALAALLAAPAALGATWRTLAAGGEAHAWFLLPVETTLGVSSERVTHGAMFRASAQANLGAISPMRAHSIFEPPLFITSYGDRLMVIYEPASGASPTTAMNQTGEARSYPVRSVRAHEGPNTIPHVAPPNRYFAEPPLVASGEIVAVADSALGLAALVRDQDALRLQVLTRTQGWIEAELPNALQPAGAVRMFADGARLALLAEDESGSTLWTLTKLDGAWTRHPVGFAAPEGELFATPGGLIAASYDDSAGAIRFHVLVDGDDSADLCVLENVPPAHAIARLGENLMIVWMDVDAPERMRVAVVSSITGRILHNDYASFGTPLTPSDLRLVAFLLSAIMLGVLLFLLKPETAIQVAPPPGWALADSGRRFVAAAADFMLAGFVASLLWDVRFGEAIDPSHLFLMESGDNWPAITALGIYFVHGVVGEWLFQRTLGKWLLRCRVSSTRGERVKLWQATARNVVKVMAPPLVALVLIDPNRRHPGDLLGGTLVVSPAERKEEPDDGDVPGVVDKSDNAEDRSSDRQD